MSLLNLLIEADRALTAFRELMVRAGTDGSGEVRLEDLEDTIKWVRSTIDNHACLPRSDRDPSDDRPMDLRRAARRLGVKSAWLKAEVDAGRLPALKAGTTALLHLPTVEAIIVERAKGGAA